MFSIFFFLHLLTAIFIIGPLVHSVTTATRGLRTQDAGATKAAAHSAGLYSFCSVAVVIFGFGLMSMPKNGKTVGSFTDTWLWGSTVLWLIAVGIVLALVVPALEKATEAITAGESVDRFKGKVAAGGGVVGVIFIAIIALMVFKP